MNLGYITTDEIIDAVSTIADVIYDTYENDAFIPELELVSNGNIAIVTFLGSIIWSSEDDEREYFEDTDSYENLLTYLRNKCIERIENLYKLKHKLKVQI